MRPTGSSRCLASIAICTLMISASPTHAQTPTAVSEDGSVVESNDGVGVVKAGWHCGDQPDATAICFTKPASREISHCCFGSPLGFSATGPLQHARLLQDRNPLTCTCTLVRAVR